MHLKNLRFLIFALAMALPSAIALLGAVSTQGQSWEAAGQTAGASFEPFTFVQLCDTQLGMGGYEHDVRTFEMAVEQINDLKPDFVVICGDLINDSTSDRAFADYNRIKAKFALPCYSASGNHDVLNFPTQPSLERYREKVGRDYYSFEHKGYTFVVVNTQLWKAPVPGETEKQDAWLETTLGKASKQKSPVFIVGHYPLFLTTPDEEDQYFNLPPQTRARLLDLFEKQGVQAVLSGHYHQNLILDYRGIQLVTSASTSRNFDGSPLGFRQWHIGQSRPYKHEYLAITNAPDPVIK